MLKKITLFWFKTQAARFARVVLADQYNQVDIEEILHSYWQKYLALKPEVPSMPTIGGSLMLHLAAMSTAFYQELIIRGQNETGATKLFYDIAWKVYVKMGKLSWRLSSVGNRSNFSRLLKATNLFRSFPFNSPSFLWEDVITEKNIVGFNCVRCPVAEFFQKRDMATFCEQTWCSLDFPLAELWHSELERTGTIAGGAAKCDFRWKPINK